MPEAGIDYPRTLGEFTAWFADEAACLAYLARLRWPDGFVCPRCANVGAWRMSDGLYRCAACRARTSATAGTILAKTRTPLRTWFQAAWYITGQKQGVSALGLQRALGLGSYETAWTWLHKFRRAMVRPGRDKLSGRSRWTRVTSAASRPASAASARGRRRSPPSPSRSAGTGWAASAFDLLENAIGHDPEPYTQIRGGPTSPHNR